MKCLTVFSIKIQPFYDKMIFHRQLSVALLIRADIIMAIASVHFRLFCM